MQRNSYSWIVKIRNTSEAVLGPQYTLGHHTDHGPVGLGQYDSLGEYCDPHTASSVFRAAYWVIISRLYIDYDYYT